MMVSALVPGREREWACTLWITAPDPSALNWKSNDYAREARASPVLYLANEIKNGGREESSKDRQHSCTAIEIAAVKPDNARFVFRWCSRQSKVRIAGCRAHYHRGRSSPFPARPHP